MTTETTTSGTDDAALSTLTLGVGPSNPQAEPIGYLATGSPGRMAALVLLGKHPGGVSSVDIRAAIRHADPRVFDEGRMAAVLRNLREAGLAATERDEAGLRWFSPGARRTAQVRGDWQPPMPAATAAITTTPITTTEVTA